MRIAVISDVHANLHALDAVLAAIDADPPEQLWCLGDTIGYGPKPNECCALIAERANVCLVGDHDLAALGSVSLADFNEEAAAAARWTRAELDESSRAFLEALKPDGEAEGVDLFHGSPEDPVWAYVLSTDGAERAFELTSRPLTLVGHSHAALAFRLADGKVDGWLARDGDEHDLGGGRWILNPGSVGQPRDDDPRASYLLLDTERRFAQHRRVAYSIETTQREMRERGLPEALAARLAHGR